MLNLTEALVRVIGFVDKCTASFYLWPGPRRLQNLQANTSDTIYF
jgi:hypothetical protein